MKTIEVKNQKDIDAIGDLSNVIIKCNGTFDGNCILSDKIVGGCDFNFATIEGDFDCRSAKIGGDFDCNYATIEGDFDCRSAKIGGDFYCHSAKIEGDFDCRSAKIGGDFYCHSAKIGGDFMTVSTATESEKIILGKIKKVIKKIDMKKWHLNDDWEKQSANETISCGTTHCLAGWAQIFGGEEYKKMDAQEAGNILLPNFKHFFFMPEKIVIEMLMKY